MSRDAATARDWLVLLEAAGEREGSTIEPSSFARMVSAWAAPAPATLYSPYRYGLHVPVKAANPQLALSYAIALWKDALGRAGLPEWELLRVEIVTPEELEQERQAAERAYGGADACREASPATEDVLGDALIERAFHDSVSGLPGRELFIDEVRRALATGPASATQAVMVLHVAGFDSGETSGGSLPENVLAPIARRLRTLVRRDDIVARIGPAEFALLVQAQSEDDTDCLARRIGDRLGHPFVQVGQPPAVTTSVGVATVSYRHDADQLVLMAEVAMVAAREAGGDCHRHFASPDSV